MASAVRLTGPSTAVFVGDIHFYGTSNQETTPRALDETLSKYRYDARREILSYSPRILTTSGRYENCRRLDELVVPNDLLKERRFFNSERAHWITRILSWWGKRSNAVDRHLRAGCVGRSTHDQQSETSSVGSVNSVDPALAASVDDILQMERTGGYALVIGDPGTGKTCFSHQIAQQALGQFEFVFRFGFGNSGPIDDITSLAEFLFTKAGFVRNDDPATEEVLFGHLLTSKAATLIILDGLDEYSHFTKLNCNPAKMSARQCKPLSCLIGNLLLGRLLDNCLIVVTSRPSRANQLCKRLREQARVYLVQRLMEEQRFEYCRRLLPDSGQAVAESAREVNEVWNVMGTPFVCQVVCAVYQSQGSLLLNEGCGLTTLYAKFLLHYINSDHVDACHELTGSQRKRLAANLARCAWQCVANNRSTFTRECFDQLGLGGDGNGERHMTAFVSDFWSVIIVDGVSARGEPEWYFVHRSLMEFFAAANLLIRPVQITSKVARVLDDPDSLVPFFYCGLRNPQSRQFREALFGPEAVCHPPVYERITTALWDRWQPGQEGDFSGCVRTLQSVCESGDTALIVRFANSLPDNIAVGAGKPQVFRPLCQLLQAKSVEANLVRVRLREEDAAVVVNLLPCGANMVELGGEGFSAEMVERIGSGMQSRSLHISGLSFQHCTTIGDRGAEHFALLCSHVRDLDLWNCGLGESGLRDFVRALRECATVAELNLGMNRVADEGAILLAASSVIRARLKRLKLRRCGIGDRGTSALAEMMQGDECALEYLSLRENQYSVVGYRDLSESFRRAPARLSSMAVSSERVRNDTLLVERTSGHLQATADPLVFGGLRASGQRYQVSFATGNPEVVFLS